MKARIILLSVVLSITTIAQRTDSTKSDNEVRTIFGDAGLKGGFISLVSKGFEMNGDYGYGAGAEVAAVFGRKVNLGFSGYGLASNVRTPYASPNGNAYMYELGYGGLFIEPMLGSIWPIHLTFPITLGAGLVSVSEYRIYDEHWYHNYDADAFLVAEGGVNVEINIFKVMRLATGVSYRQTTDVYLPGHRQQLTGFSANVSLRIGWF